MIFRDLFVFITLLTTVLAKAQNNETVLFSIDEEPIYAAEFIRVFQKNKDIVVEEDHKGFDSYFDLFVDFRLKLKQAYELKLDTISSYQNELKKYKEQLIEPYLKNEESSEFLIKEAYDRTVQEVNASHILIRVNPDAKPSDTLIAYNKIIEARNTALRDNSFENVAIKYSEDPSVESNGGSLGYFSAFSMVYAFENAAYHTRVNEISLPFRTQFGYHILKVNDIRNSRGEIQVAHIMIKDIPGDSTFAQNNINDIYNKLNQSGDFAKIAQEHSDDTSSAKKGGALPKFSSGKMIEPFDSIAFSLKNIGDVSKPFHSNYGWHILKLLNKYPIQSFEILHDQLKSKINKGGRSNYAQNSLAIKLEKDYEISENLEVLSSFHERNEEEMKSDKKLLIINDVIYVAKDFYIFNLSKKNKIIGELYIEFRNEKIIDYYKSQLENTNKEFADIYQEYKDGLLLFELLQKNIWEKSETDSVGLRKYFEDNKSKYSWKKRGELTIASCTSLDKANWVKKYLDNNKSVEEIKSLMNDGATIHVLFSSGTLEEGSIKLPENFIIHKGVSEIYNEKDHEFTIIRVDQTVPVSPKKFKETRGEVINDYQIYLEKLWVSNLHEDYKVKINKRVLKRLKSQYADL